MASFAGDSSPANQSEKKNSQRSEKFKFFHRLEEKEKQFIISNCKLFDKIFLDSLNVLPPSSSKDFNLAFNNSLFEIFSPDLVSKMNSPQDPSVSKMNLFKAINFFNGFENEKQELLLKLFHSVDIFPPNLKPQYRYLENLIEHFEYDEDSFFIDFWQFKYEKEKTFSALKCSFLKLFSTFGLKKITIRYFHPRNDEFKSLVSLLAQNQTSLLHLEFENCNFTKCNPSQSKIYFPNLQNIYLCNSKGLLKLGVLICPKLVSFESHAVPLDDLQFTIFPNENSRKFSIHKNQFAIFLKNNPQLENLACHCNAILSKNKKIEEALFYLTNLKRLNIPIQAPFENYVVSKKIERLAVRKPSSEDLSLNWKYLAEFPLLSYLKLYNPFPLKKDFISYLQLDLLEILSIDDYWFQEDDEKKFFKCIFQLKKLKALRASLRWKKGIVLCDSIQCAFFAFEGIKTEYEFSGSNYSEYVIEEFSSFLPRGANVKYLTIFGLFEDNETPGYSGNLKDNFPKLEILRNDIGFEIKPNGFSIIQDYFEFQRFSGYEF